MSGDLRNLSLFIPQPESHPEFSLFPTPSKHSFVACPNFPRMPATSTPLIFRKPHYSPRKILRRCLGGSRDPHPTAMGLWSWRVSHLFADEALC